MLVRIEPSVSGLRPIACNAPLTNNPMPMPGPIAPKPIAKPVANMRIPSFVMSMPPSKTIMVINKNECSAPEIQT
jgi:hypothetical protein